MVKIEPIDVREYALDIYRDFTLSARKNEPGAPKRIDDVIVAIVTMTTENAPHGGEMHPHSDELLCVVSGKLRIAGDSLEEETILLSDRACIRPKGE